MSARAEKKKARTMTAAMIAALMLAPSAPAPEDSVSWDILGGRVPSRSILIAARNGFPRLIEVDIAFPLSDRWSIGGFGGLGLGHYVTLGADDDVGLFGGAAVRYSLLTQDGWSIGVYGGLGLRADLGLRRSGVSLLFPVGIQALYDFGHRIFIGGGLYLPLRVGFPSEASTFAQLPILPQLLGEFRLFPAFGLIAALGLGPTVGGTAGDVAVQVSLGAAFRL